MYANKPRVSLLLLAVWPLGAMAQTHPTNLNLEEGEPGEVPEGWVVPPAAKESYSVSLTEEGAKSGKRCVVLAKSDGHNQAGFGNLMQSCGADDYRGKPVHTPPASCRCPAI